MSAIADEVPSSWRFPLSWGIGTTMAMVLLVIAGGRSSTEASDPPAESFWECEDTHNAASASEANVTTAITAADDDDCVVVPSGAATWTDLSLQSKDIQLIGASTITCSGTAGTDAYTCAQGATNTTISMSGATTTVSVDLDSKQRITGFVFTGAEDDIVACTGNQDVTKFFRFDHNVFISTAGWHPIRCIGATNDVHPSGIFDHNRVENGIAIHTTGLQDDIGGQHAIWATDPGLGDEDGRIFTEANYFTTNVGIKNFADGNYGARGVLRFNTTDGEAIAGFEFHAVQGTNRAYQVWEAYGNTFDDLGEGTTCFFGMFFFRAGSGVAFNNELTGVTDDCNNDFFLDNVRSDSGWGPEDGVARCNGSSGWDQNTGGSSGYHCRDQIGVYRDNSLWTFDPTPAAYDQAFRPAYFWNNKREGAQGAAEIDDTLIVPTHIQANRDFYDYDGTFDGTTGTGVGTIGSRPATCTAGVGYWATDEGEWNDTNGATADGRLYRCTATNTWTLFYTPTAYPHPWTN